MSYKTTTKQNYGKQHHVIRMNQTRINMLGGLGISMNLKSGFHVRYGNKWRVEKFASFLDNTDPEHAIPLIDKKGAVCGSVNLTGGKRGC